MKRKVYKKEYMTNKHKYLTINQEWGLNGKILHWDLAILTKQ